ncbi:MAG TPA: hypothetical protein VMJ64_18780 [Anaerolineales bacterium]|nr:hypothetical protein [Anaerolineales bacterium]
MARTLFVILLLGLCLSACAPAAPTIDPAQIQASAVSAASTMIALTVAAVPTNTPVPPTPIPSPTLPPPTLAPLPTLPAGQASPTTASASTCNQLLDVGASGPTAPVLIKNNTKGQITFNMGFNKKNTFGQCGYMSTVVGKGQSSTVHVPLVHTNLGDACYWVYVWVNDPKTPKTLSPNAVYCIDNGLKWTFNVTPTNVVLAPP